MSATDAAVNPLFAVRDCLRQRQLASAAEIAACVQVPVAVAQDMLAHWVQRGLIARLDAQGATCNTGACARCGACGSGHTATVLYRWCGGPSAAARPVLMLRSA
ncbi:MAG: FeoC-like transcriptional regulator [Thiomonas sp.]